MFGTSGDYLISLGFKTNQGLKYGPWGDCTLGTPYQFVGPLTRFFGAIGDEGLVALGAWASAGSVVTPAPPPPTPFPTLDAEGFDVDEPCPQTLLIGSGIDYDLMENQVRAKTTHYARLHIGGKLFLLLHRYGAVVCTTQKVHAGSCLHSDTCHSTSSLLIW
jgi:hypothetical protein